MSIFKKGAAVIMALSLFAGAMPGFALADESARIVNLKVNDVVNPIGIDVSPTFSWQMESDITGEAQKAYNIVVWDESAPTEAIWDSGKVESDESVSIPYAGKPLETAKRYAWQVSVWDTRGIKLDSEKAYFETGLLNSADWGKAQWIKVGNSSDNTDSQDDPDYVIDADMKIANTGVALIFEARDKSNFLMWQLRTDKDNKNKLLLRPHYCKNGSFSVVGETEITDKAIGAITDVQHLKIQVKDGKITTFVNDNEINTIEFSALGGITPESSGAALGFRADSEEKEDGWIDNIVVTDYSSDQNGKTVKSYDFNDGENPFDAGKISDRRLCTTYIAGTTLVSFEKSAGESAKIKYSVQADITCIKDAVSLVFSAKDSKNFYMWQFNTEETPGRVLLRPHACVDGAFSVYTANVRDITDSVGSVDSFAQNEAHIKIDVTQDEIKTYINGTLADTLAVGAKTETGAVAHTPVIASVGTRTSGDETGTIDNLSLTDYLNDDAGRTVYSYDFDSVNPFAAGEIENGRYIAGGNRGVTLAYTGADTFRKEFTAQKQLLSARIYMSALGVFDAYINGERIGIKNSDGTVTYDELKPGFTKPGVRTFYYTYDVTDYIVSGGQNALSATVTTGWWGGMITRYYGQNSAFKAKLLLKYTDGTFDEIVTDGTWKSKLTGPVLYGDIYGGEIYDANSDVSYRTAGYDDADWYNAKKDAQFSGELCAQHGAEVRIRSDKELSAKSVAVYDGAAGATSSKHGKINIVRESENGEFLLKKGETAVVDLGQNFAGFEQITVNGEKGTVITIRHGEMLNDKEGIISRGNDGPEGSVYTANLRSAAATTRYITNGAQDETYHPTNTFYGFRYLSITSSKDIRFKDVKGLVITSALKDTGFIKTSNDKVNQLISNIKWGQYSNYLSVPTDCPQRDERQGWTADTQVFSAAAAYNADSKAFLKKYCQDMRDSQRSDGAFAGTAPFENYGASGQLGWCDAGVIIPYNLYKMYGDKSVIEENYAAMKKFMDVFMASTNKKGAGHDYGDWLAYESNDETIKSMLGVVYYAYDALLMSEMAKVTGKTADSEKYQKVYQTEKEYFIKNYVKSDGNLKRTEQTVCLFALKLDLLPDAASRAKVKNTLLNNIKSKGNKLQTGFLGTSIITQTLSDIGADDVAYKLLLQENNPSWLYSVNQGATTIWERWNSYTKESGFGDVGMNSFNHYAYGAVSEWMFKYMAGISTDDESVGFKRTILHPTPDKSMEYVDCSYESPYGTIVSSWKYADNGWDYTAKIPANTTAKIILPAGEYNEITVNKIGADKLALDKDGIAYVKTENGKTIFEAASGEYKFSVKNSSNTEIKSVKVDGISVKADGDGFTATVAAAKSHNVEVVTKDAYSSAVYSAEKGTITVTAQDGTVKEYTLSIIEKTPDQKPDDDTPPAVKPDAKPSVPKNGTTVKNGKTILYKNGKAVIGTKVVTVAGKTYAVVKGYVKTGKGNRRITIANKTYVINKSGVVLTGKANRIVKVGKKKYIVNKKGVVLKKKKRIKIGRVIYSTDKKGVATKKK